ncbi:MAG: hypothetical protein NC041_04130 [Bacteroides sp.]|nr:hypothetical protein [Prevotella sp.]MCM1407894.1 hypothetical protein [Treponema brennaborense]MCM1469636.1 hypothetical protein [Bacteroides sp.]
MKMLESVPYVFSAEEIYAIFKLLRKNSEYLHDMKLEKLYRTVEKKLYNVFTIEEVEELLNET